MKRVFLALFTLLTVHLQADVLSNVKNYFTQSDKGTNPQTIRVLIVKEAEGAMLQVTDSYNIFDPKDGRRLGTRFLAKNMFIQPLAEGLRWGEEFPGTYQVQIVPDNSYTSVLVDGKQYLGQVTVYQIGIKISVVNELPIEDYIRSTLATKVEASFQEETLATLAIAERSNAFFKVKHPQSQFYDVDATEEHYEGEGIVFMTPNTAPAVERAIASTKNLILTHGNAPLIMAWTEHCGGLTAPFHLIHRKDVNSPTQGVKSPLAYRNRDEAKWQTEVTVAALADAVGLKEITRFELFTDPQSGKVATVRFFDRSVGRDVSFNELEEKIGKNVVQSSEFRLSITGETATFEGVGKGPGVGICIYTAEEMSKRGLNAAQIVEAFYPGTQMQRMPSKQVAQLPVKKKKKRRAA